MPADEFPDSVVQTLEPPRHRLVGCRLDHAIGKQLRVIVSEDETPDRRPT
jgi:hypothetical protein